jgi:hypothetical protein
MSNLFNNIDNINAAPAISYLEDSIKMFVDYALLEIGSFINVNRPTLDINNNSGFHKLNYVNDPSLPNRVWEAQRKDWVYESEIVYKGNNPINIDGIYVNNTFIPTSDTGQYSYKINYPLGRVVFNNPIDTSFVVEADYSYRYIQTIKSLNAPWLIELQKYSYDSSKFKFFGDYFTTGNHRIQLPCIVIELAPRTVLSPYELGSIKNYITQDVLFHILAENKTTAINISDSLLAQKDNTFNLLNIVKIITDNIADLDSIGQKNTNRVPYKIVSESFEHIKNRCIIKNSTILGLSSLSSDLYNSTVRWSVEIFP